MFGYLHLLHFFFHIQQNKIFGGDLWRSVQTWFISWPQLSVVRQAYRNPFPVVLAGPGTWGSSNSQQSKPLSSLAILRVFVKLNPPKTWHLLRWWIFAFMFQRTNKCNVCRQEMSGGFGAGSATLVSVGPELPWWSRVPQQFLAVTPPAFLLWKDLVSFYVRLTLIKNWGTAGIVVNPVERLGIPA